MMKKILIVIDSMYGGGAERVTSRIANELAVDNEVIIYTQYTPEMYPLAENIKVLYFKWPTSDLIPYYKSGGRFLRPLNRLYHVYCLIKMCEAIKKKENPDVTLSLLKIANLMNAFSKGSGRKVCSERNNPRFKDSEYRFLGRLSFLRADCVVFQTETVRNQFNATIRKKGIVVPNPVLVDCKATGYSKRIVTMGKMHPQKNHSLLIKAFALFAKSHPDYMLHIYGKDWGGERVQPLIEDLSLSDKVFIEGFKEPVHPQIADAQLFVLSSDYEGTPNALLEAMMMGLPCITTAFEGSRELLGNDPPCLVTPCGDEIALAEAMEHLADDSVLRETLSQRGKQFTEAFKLDKVILKWRDALFK